MFPGTAGIKGCVNVSQTAPRPLMRMRTLCCLLAVIAGTAGLCVEEEDVARLCTAGTNLAYNLSRAVEECSQTSGQRELSEGPDFRDVLGLGRQSSHYCYTTDEIETLFQHSLESKWLVSR